MKKLFKNKVVIILDVLIIAFFGIYLGLNLKNRNVNNAELESQGDFNLQSLLANGSSGNTPSTSCSGTLTVSLSWSNKYLEKSAPTPTVTATARCDGKIISGVTYQWSGDCTGSGSTGTFNTIPAGSSCNASGSKTCKVKAKIGSKISDEAKATAYRYCSDWGSGTSGTYRKTGAKSRAAMLYSAGCVAYEQYDSDKRAYTKAYNRCCGCPPTPDPNCYCKVAEPTVCEVANHQNDSAWVEKPAANCQIPDISESNCYCKDGQDPRCQYKTPAEASAGGWGNPVEDSNCDPSPPPPPVTYDLTVYHYAYGTTTSVCATQGPTTYNENASYTTAPCTPPSDYAYANDHAGDAVSGTMNSNKEVIYYYRPYYNLTVYHYIEGTNTMAPNNCAKVGPTKYLLGASYSTNACSTLKDGWRFVRNDGDPTSGNISKDTQVLYYYEPKPASLLVHHYEWDGLTNRATTTSVCTDQETRNLHWYDTYQTSECEPDIEFELYRIPDNKNGIIEHDQEVVTYYYIRKAKLHVNHYEWDGINHTATTRKLCDSVEENHIYGDTYQTSACTTVPTGYELISMPSNANGTIRQPETIVNYYYNRKGNLKVYHYVWDGLNNIETTESVCPMTSEDLSFGTSYSKSRCNPGSGYRYYKVEDDPEKADPPNGVISKFETVVKFYYIQTAKLTVHHYLWDLNNNRGTTNSLYDDQVTNNLDYGTTYTTSAHNLNGTNYSLYKVDGDPANGKINKPETVVIYYYAPIADLTVHHYIKGTTTRLCDDLISKVNYFDNYSTEVCQSALDNYRFYSVGSNDSTSTISNQVVTGSIKQASTVITYYYELKPAKVTVHHYKWDVENDIGTTNKLCEDIVTNTTYTASYQSDKCNNLNDNSYKYMKVVSTDVNSSIVGSQVSGTVKQDEIVITYYYDYKPAKVTVHHYIKDTTTKVHADEVTYTTYNVPYETNSLTTDKLGDLYRNWYEYIDLHTGDPVSGIVNQDEMVVNYFYDRMQARVIVHHYIKGTTTKLHEDEIQDLRYHDSYTSSHKEPAQLSNPNYRYESVVGDDPSGLVNKPLIEITYYYNARPAKIIVHHYKEGTTESVCEDIIEENKLYGEGYETHACENLPDTHNEFKRVISDDPNSNINNSDVTGTFNQDVVIITYYYGLKPARVITHHYEVGTTNRVHADDDDQNKKHLDPYTTNYYESSALDDDHKNWYIYINQTAGDQPNGVIDKDLVEVIYYYDKKPAKLTVHHYIEGTTTKLAEDEVTDYKYHDPYETHYKESNELIDTDYIYKSTDGDPVSGTINKDNVEVIYYYALKPARVIVHHYIDGTTTKLCNDVTINKHYKDEYNTTKCTNLNDNAYKFKEVISDDPNSTINADNVTGTVKQDTIVITYYYDLKPAKITVHHYIENTTTKLCDDSSEDKLYKDHYTTNACVDLFDNDYKYKEVITDDPNSSFDGSKVDGTVNQDEIVVTYYYELKPAKVVVHHYIDGTTTKLCDDENYMMKFKDDYDINLCTHLSDDAYKYKEVISSDISSNIEGSKVTGKVTNNFEVIYYYDLKSSEIIVHHVELDTHVKLAEDVHYSGLVYDTVTISDVDIEGYKLVLKPENEDITFTVEPQEFTYYYSRLKYNIEVEVLEGEGTITCPEQIYHGDDSTPDCIVVTPHEEWEISKIIIDDEEIEVTDPEGMVIENFKHVTEHHKVQVIFVEKPIPVPITGRVSKLLIVAILILMASAFIFLRQKSLGKSN